MLRLKFSIVVLMTTLFFTSFTTSNHINRTTRIMHDVKVSNYFTCVQKGSFTVTAADGHVFNCLAILTAENGASYTSVSDDAGQYTVNITETSGGYDYAAYEIYGTFSTDLGDYSINWTTPIDWTPSDGNELGGISIEPL